MYQHITFSVVHGNLYICNVLYVFTHAHACEAYPTVIITGLAVSYCQSRELPNMQRAHVLCKFARNKQHCLRQLLVKRIIIMCGYKGQSWYLNMEVPESSSTGSGHCSQDGDTSCYQHLLQTTLLISCKIECLAYAVQQKASN